MIREILDNDFVSLFGVRVATRENAMSLQELGSIGITEESMKLAIKGFHRGWLYEVGGRPVGFAMGDYEASEFTVIAILPEYEYRGIGRQLLTKVENWLQLKGCEEIWLTTDIDTNLRAYGFYKKYGWQDKEVKNGLRYMFKRFRA